MPRMEWNSEISKWTKSCPHCERVYEVDGSSWENGQTNLLQHFTPSKVAYDSLYVYCKDCSRHKSQGRTPDGLTILERANAQDHKCGICLKDMDITDTKRTFIDHDHKTKKIRKILCPSCNYRMSGVDDDEWLALAISYRDHFRREHG